MIARLFLLFTFVPAIELFLLLQLGALMGPLPTFLLIVTTGFVGASLARSQGLAVLRQLADDASRGLPPAERVAEGALIVAGGLLLVTPGPLTDLTGLLCILPPTRRWLAPRVWRFVARHVLVIGPNGPVRPGVGTLRPGAPRPPQGAREPASSPFDHPIAD